MNLIGPVFKAVMNKGFNVPTPVQRKAIPYILEGRDVVVSSRTGSGKTAAFIIPMLNKLKQHSKIVGKTFLMEKFIIRQQSTYNMPDQRTCFINLKRFKTFYKIY